MISDDTKILKDGSVDGTLKYISEFTNFSTIPEEQSGNYFPVVLGEKYKGKTIKVTGEKEKSAADLEWILRVKDKNSTFKFEAENQEIMTLSFKDTAFNPAPIAYSSKKSVARKKTSKSTATAKDDEVIENA